MNEVVHFSKPTGDFVYPRLPRAVALSIIDETRSVDLGKLQVMSSFEHPAAAPVPTGTQVDRARLVDD